MNNKMMTFRKKGISSIVKDGKIINIAEDMVVEVNYSITSHKQCGRINLVDIIEVVSQMDAFNDGLDTHFTGTTTSARIADYSDVSKNDNLFIAVNKERRIYEFVTKYPEQTHVLSILYNIRYCQELRIPKLMITFAFSGVFEDTKYIAGFKDRVIFNNSKAKPFNNDTHYESTYLPYMKGKHNVILLPLVDTEFESFDNKNDSWTSPNGEIISRCKQITKSGATQRKFSYNGYVGNKYTDIILDNLSVISIQECSRDDEVRLLLFAYGLIRHLVLLDKKD